MALKLKLDGNGAVVVTDGKPVYIDDVDGKEVAYDANQTRSKIAELNQEAKDRRLENEKLTNQLKKYGDATPEDVEKFLETVEGLGGLVGIEELKKKSNVDVDSLKKSMQDAFDAKNKATVDGFEKKLAEKEKVLAEKDTHIYKLMVSSQFGVSKYATENLILPPDIAEATFGKHFKVEDGQVVAYLGDNKILSRDKPGEVAPFDEALAVIVEAYPMKDRILKSQTAIGTGAPQTKHAAKGNDALLKLPPTDRMTEARKQGIKT